MTSFGLENIINTTCLIGKTPCDVERPGEERQVSGLLRGRLRRQLGSQPLLSPSQNDDRGCEEISPLVPQATYDALSHSLLTQRTSLPLQPLQRYT
jgi:hypothetical protein